MRQDRLLRAMTGLNRKAFEALLPALTIAYEQISQEQEKPRQRAKGGGRKARLKTITEKFLHLILL